MSLSFPKGRSTVNLLGIVYSLIVLSVIGFLNLIKLSSFHGWNCLFKSFTGFPCPSCGGTRCLIHVSNFQIMDALRYNPLVFIGVVGLLIWGLCASILTVANRKLEFHITPQEQILCRIILGMLILLNWSYLILKHI